MLVAASAGNVPPFRAPGRVFAAAAVVWALAITAPGTTTRTSGTVVMNAGLILIDYVLIKEDPSSGIDGHVDGLLRTRSSSPGEWTADHG
jgi:hypothetical protein